MLVWSFPEEKAAKEALKKNEPILKIECTLLTSIPFWEYT